MKVVFKIGGLTKLKDQLTSAGKVSRVQVGILANKPRAEGDLTNAEIGAIHEFGSYSERIPQRSFLLMPLTFHLGKNLKGNWTGWILSGGMVNAAKHLGVMAEKTIQQAFATGGFGEWRPLAPSTIARKGSSAILIDTAQLRRSISYRVV